MGATEWTVIGIGVAIVIVNAGLVAWLRGDLAKLGERVNALSERMVGVHSYYVWRAGRP